MSRKFADKFDGSINENRTPQGLKPSNFQAFYGPAEAVP